MVFAVLQNRNAVRWHSQPGSEGENMMTALQRLVHDDQGQDLIEYALLAGFISLVAVLAITAVGTGVNSVYGNIDTQVGLISP